jgi:hypothetical protein
VRYGEAEEKADNVNKNTEHDGDLTVSEFDYNRLLRYGEDFKSMCCVKHGKIFPVLASSVSFFANLNSGENNE